MLPSIKTLVFGGSFDPPHRGHEAVLASAKKLFPAAKIIVTTAWQTPVDSKNVKPVKTSFEKRLHMSHLAFLKGGIADEVSEIESTLDAPSYTFKTLQALTERGTTQPLGLLIGMDQWLKFDQWYQAKDILQTASVIVYPRGYTTSARDLDLPLKALDLPYEVSPNFKQIALKGSTHSIVFLDVPTHPASSTVLRAELAAKKTEHKDWLNPLVFDYIRTCNLYSRGEFRG